jgi:hypothetical protein
MAGLMEQLRDPARGLKSITDEQLAEVHLAEVLERGPVAAARALQNLTLLREKGWRAEWELERKRNDEMAARIEQLEAEVRRLEKRDRKELEEAKDRMEKATRAAVTLQVRREVEMAGRVKAGVDRLVPGPRAPKEEDRTSTSPNGHAPS